MSVVEPEVKTATILSGASLSDAVQVGQAEVAGFVLPALTAAALSFQGSHDGATYGDVYDTSMAEVSLGSSTGSRAVQAPAALKGFSFIKVRSGLTAAPVNQGANRSIAVILK